MGWDKGRYYTRSRKVNGQVVREYVGSGVVGTLAAQLDQLQREERAAERDAARLVLRELAALDAAVRTASEAANAAARDALRAAGYHQRKRGQWRKRRGQEAGDTGH